MLRDAPCIPVMSAPVETPSSSLRGMHVREDGQNALPPSSCRICRAVGSMMKHMILSQAYMAKLRVLMYQSRNEGHLLDNNMGPLILEVCNEAHLHGCGNFSGIEGTRLLPATKQTDSRPKACHVMVTHPTFTLLLQNSLQVDSLALTRRSRGRFNHICCCRCWDCKRGCLACNT